MHPRIFLDTFWRYDLRNEIFVAMSFEQKYDTRWHNIFRLAIESVVQGNCSFNAVRVDIRKSGDSILTEIMDGIAHSQLVLADISVTDRWSIDGKERYTRNGNVMYEVGLALACRQPVEVILLRDDNEKLLFDVSHIPVITFDPGNISQSVELIRGCIKDRLKERQLAKDMRIKRIVESLNDSELLSIAVNIHLNDPDDLDFFMYVKPEKLLEKGLIRIIRTNINEQGRFSWTPFGKVIADLVKHNIPKGDNPLIWKSKKDREARQEMEYQSRKRKSDREQEEQWEKEREEMRNRPLIWKSKKDREARQEMEYQSRKRKSDREQEEQWEKEREEMRNRFPFLKSGDY